VVVIHGLGAIARNTTLQEAVNTLAYWFNHKAGLALEREGLGRIWVRARLTDDPNPDAPAARASMQLLAPPEKAPATGIEAAVTQGPLPSHPPSTLSGRSTAAGEDALRLEFREVWWAQSFGLPSITSTIAWARVQAVEQVTHLLIPIHLHRGSRQGADDGTAPARIPRRFTQTERFLLAIALGAYSVGQYVWKLVEWLILTPLVLLLLLVMGLLRTLVALIPPLQSTVIAAFSSLLDTIMLHWVSEARVYSQDYTRSAGIRERFEREVVRFLRDDKCERIVVIAHSMGTVIAYEGLTTVLERPEFQKSQKPMTYICLAQALRRIWLMTADDPHRLRGVLPERVRWLHFWGG